MCEDIPFAVGISCRAHFYYLAVWVTYALEAHWSVASTHLPMDSSWSRNNNELFTYELRIEKKGNNSTAIGVN